MIREIRKKNEIRILCVIQVDAPEGRAVVVVSPGRDVVWPGKVELLVVPPLGVVVLPVGTVVLPVGTVVLPDGTVVLPVPGVVLPDVVDIDGVVVVPPGATVVALP